MILPVLRKTWQDTQVISAQPIQPRPGASLPHINLATCPPSRRLQDGPSHGHHNQVMPAHQVSGGSSALRSASVCSTDLPLLRPQRAASRWMWVSTGNAACLQPTPAEHQHGLIISHLIDPISVLKALQEMPNVLCNTLISGDPATC